MEAGMGRAVKVCNMISLWDRVVDERVRKQTEAIKISHRILYVSTSSPAWAQELTFLRKDFIEKFNKEAGKDIIRDIKFKAGGWHG
jgi:predicted nucleic acid-binding Zn ribbon protein